MRRRLRSAALAAALVIAPGGCGGGGGGDAVDGGTDGGGGGDGPEVPACDGAEPARPASIATIDHVPASEDFVFDAGGFVVGVTTDLGDLVRTPRDPDDPQQIVAPAVSDFGRGTRALPGGDLVLADPSSGTVRRFAANGSSTPIAALDDPNGIAVGAAGMLYVTSGAGRVVRIDPGSGEVLEIHSSATESFDGVALSPDDRTLYFNRESGEISRVAIDGGGAAGPVETHAVLEPELLLDGMTTDVCGNLYVVDMAGAVWMVTPGGVADEWVDLRGVANFVPAVNFGSGRGGWSATALYIMDFDGGIHEAEVGIEGRLDPHLR